MRTPSGLGPGFTATAGHQGLGVPLPAVSASSTRLPRLLSGYRQSCVRLPSLADGVNGVRSARRALVQNGAGGPLDPGVLPALGGGAPPVRSLSVFGAHPYTTTAPGTTAYPPSLALTPGAPA